MKEVFELTKREQRIIVIILSLVVLLVAFRSFRNAGTREHDGAVAAPTPMFSAPPNE